MTDDPRTAALPIPAGDWFHPWPNVFELAASLPTSDWTLVGGLMAQGPDPSHDQGCSGSAG